MTADPNHTANQYNVARLLVPVLIRANVDAGFVESMSARDWARSIHIARTLDEIRYEQECDDPTRDPTRDRASIQRPWQPRPSYLPSASTRALIATMIKAETAPVPSTDPFAGLPGVDD